ncbi:MAG TPA: hypothetical protein PL063_02010 [Candidatus Cloacimonadota bacterium]|jgi:hypothetical protein|nr:hypothetical protein [Candidatus Cloacimonadales bacterium]HOE91579.1 hypothetical protein [Candidatus Cloacimonadota bacterium]HPY95968.1 hypothetical protein [Candidatus Cloacimonadota bacterium]HQB40428.1 hypothetical protein [Candidatus Cloacimonadota bacterium]
MINLWTSVGIWLGALSTLAIWSFLYKDNPFYKIAEQIFVGVSAAYWLVYTIYNILIPNLFSKLIADPKGNWVYYIPGVLGLMMVLRVIPKFEKASFYPLSLLIGTTAGISLLRFLKSDVLAQTTATMLNPFANANIAVMIGQIIIIIGTITGLIYFYFSKKHQGFVGVNARIGIIFLMISFGASFGYTVMARISLLIGRLQFLFGDWLHLIK